MGSPTITNQSRQSRPLEAVASPRETRARERDTTVFRAWYWALLPVLAIVAYATVLRVGFLSDDYMQVYAGRLTGVSVPALLPGEHSGFYRPVGVLLIWQLGYYLWGYNPFPFHFVQLCIHAANSLLLGLWLWRLSGKPVMGWLAGALFATFPLHLEAVGFVGAQFDSYSVLFALLTLISFTEWWSHRDSPGRAKWGFYGLAFIFYSLGVMTKEILFLFLPVLFLAAWIARRPASILRGGTLLVLSLAPFLAPVLLNIVLRYSKWGTLGGYGAPTAPLSEVFLDNFGIFIRLLLSPVNPVVAGASVPQIVGLATTVGLLVLLTLYGREQRWLLLLSGVWIAVTLLPVLNMPPRADDLEGNRYLYLASAGYMVGVAALLYSLVRQVRPRWRSIASGAIAVLVLLCIGGTWFQLRTWHTATVQVNEIVNTMLRLVPAHQRPNGFAWYAQDIPSRFKGVPVLLSGLGISRIFANGGIDYPNIVRVEDASHAPLNADNRDAYRLRFEYNPETTRYEIAYLDGISEDSPPPSGREAGDNLRVWDFRTCQPDALAAWEVAWANSNCEAGKGLTVGQSQGDPQMLNPKALINPSESAARYVRLRVAVGYPAGMGNPDLSNEWFWGVPGESWSAERTHSLPVRQDGRPHVYWTFIPARQVAAGINGLRFDPATANVPATVEWIAVDLIE